MWFVKLSSITSHKYCSIYEAIEQPWVEFKGLVNEGWKNHKVSGRMKEGRTEGE